MMGYYNYDYYPHHEGGLEMFLCVVFWVAVVSLIIYTVKRHGGMCHGKHCGHGGYKELGSQSAIDILKERYAKGEIEKKEFEEKKKDLME
jgi:putative membrane protein